MRVDEYYTFGDDYFYLHMNANGKPEDFDVTGRDDMLLKPTMGFFNCYVKLQYGHPSTSNYHDTTQQKYLRGRYKLFAI